jgi:2-polyprenyl-3-methyl-5-hydroxy-6-metoxy-1,4-benzoquinol methylase
MGWRFREGDWGRAGGNIQSLLFYKNMYDVLFDLGLLPTQDPKEGQWLKLEWHDYGCAEGDGLAFLQMMLPLGDFAGFDSSWDGMQNATERWPTLKFDVGDVYTPLYTADVISCLHTLEHIEDPLRAIREMVNHARHFVVIITPTIIGDAEADGGHFDAMLTKDLDAAIRAEFDAKFVSYLTYRRVPDTTETIMQESNNLWIIKGQA